MKMKNGFYPRLAANGIRNNKKLCFPYILTCVCMVMMTYILAALSQTPLLRSMKGGASISFTLNFGTWVMVIFSLVFLYYTNSFLIRRRTREFGLYHILGMDKKSIGRIIAWESFFISGTSLAAGLILGITFSKFAELGLFNLLGLETDFDLRISPEALGKTVLCFFVIFFVVYLRARILVRRSDPLRLMKTENYGEKPPRANFWLAILGLVLLGGAYALAVSIRSPLKAMALFFVAVIMVIVATYVLMITGSVTFCRVLQKNKAFYYRKRHFVSLSTMSFRMKRNGAGLASVCILCTMVLVTLTSTGSLYIGAEDGMRTRYPRDITGTIALEKDSDMTDEQFDRYCNLLAETVRSHGATPKNLIRYRYAELYGKLDGTVLYADSAEFFDPNTEGVFCVFLLPLEDYNRITGNHLHLEPGQAFLAALRGNFRGETLQIGSTNPFTVLNLPDFDIPGITGSSVLFPALCLVTADYDARIVALSDIRGQDGDPVLYVCRFFGLDTGAGAETDSAILDDFWKAMVNLPSDAHFATFSLDSLAATRNVFFLEYGGLFFIGIVLSVVFLFAAILILYYKQICEGYEDQARFGIMRNVGMTGKDIRRSVNGQMFTVFFLPLIIAGLHLSFAFPMIWQILCLFSLSDLSLAIAVTGGTFLVFALFYVLVWRITSNAYCAIVNNGKP